MHLCEELVLYQKGAKGAAVVDGLDPNAPAERFFFILCKMPIDGAEFTIYSVLLCNHRELEGLQGGREFHQEYS